VAQFSVHRLSFLLVRTLIDNRLLYFVFANPYPLGEIWNNAICDERWLKLEESHVGK
jgi:hypothetical protein